MDCAGVGEIDTNERSNGHKFDTPCGISNSQQSGFPVKQSHPLWMSRAALTFCGFVRSGSSTFRDCPPLIGTVSGDSDFYSYECALPIANMETLYCNPVREQTVLFK